MVAKKKEQPCVYFQRCSVLGLLGPSSLRIHELLLWLPLFPYRVGTKKKRLAEGNGIRYIYSSFS